MWMYKIKFNIYAYAKKKKKLIFMWWKYIKTVGSN